MRLEPAPDPGSAEWLALRNRNRERWMMGDQEAVTFLAALGEYVELWDDLIDRDREIAPARVHDTLASALLLIACNPFVARHHAHLMPVLVQMCSSYLDSEDLCRHPDRRVRGVAFHTRNYPLELYHACAFLVGGWAHLRSVGPEIRAFFAFEAFDQWEYADG